MIVKVSAIRMQFTRIALVANSLLYLTRSLRFSKMLYEDMLML